HFLEGLRHRVDLKVVAFGLEIVATGVEYEFEERVFVRGGLRDDDQSLLVEHPGDRSGFGKVAMVLLKHRSDLADGAIAVVSGYIDEDGDAARPVTFVSDLFVDRAGKLAGTALDRALDVVGGHVDGLRVIHGLA